VTPKSKVLVGGQPPGWAGWGKTNDWGKLKKDGQRIKDDVYEKQKLKTKDLKRFKEKNDSDSAGKQSSN